jgi:AraC-like DNA-binding protein
MDARVLKALHQLESCMGEGMFIQDVAASVGLSLFHFHRLFHEQTGETPPRLPAPPRALSGDRQQLQPPARSLDPEQWLHDY